MTHPLQIGIREQMEVHTVDGACLGRVRDLSRPGVIKLSSTSGSAAKEIDVNWIAWVDGSVYLKKTRDQILSQWRDFNEGKYDAAA